MYSFLVSKAAAELAGAAAVALHRLVEVRLGEDAARALVVVQRGAAHVERVQVGRRPLAQTAERPLQRVLERLPEVAVEVGVDQRVQRRVGVAHPEQNHHHHVRARTRVTAQGRYHVPVTRDRQKTRFLIHGQKKIMLLNL